MLELQTASEVSSQSRRWVFTINNPLGTDVEEIDIKNTDLEIKEDYYDLSVLSLSEFKECFIYKYVPITFKSEEDFTEETFIVKRPFFKSIELAQTYFERLEHFKYCIFQLERGENGTEHFQGALIFSIGKRFKNVKRYLPTAHLEKARGSNSQMRDYCSKEDTRVEGPFELGEFAEERDRTDIKDFIRLVQSGATKQDLSRLYPNLYIKERNKIENIKADNYEDYEYRCRDVDVTYIYGDSGVGKSTYIRRKIGLKNTFFVHSYDNAMFTNYKYQDNLVLDEFAGQMKIQTLNQLLDVMPFEMRGLGCLKYATFHHVYIISNYKPVELYKQIQEDEPRIFQSFNRRLHKIIYVDENGIEKVERETIWEDCDNQIDIEQGLTKQISKTIQYDKYGLSYTLYDRHQVSGEQLLIPLDEDDPINDLF